MKKMKVIPAIDIIEGKCVRLNKGNYKTKKEYGDPVEIARMFEDTGFKNLHLVDLDGAKSKHIVNVKVLNDIASKTSMKIDFGGGIKSDNDIKIAFDAGANQITAGSIAANNRDMFLSWVQKYGAERIILGADVKNKKIATKGWLESSEIELIEFIKDYEKLGLKYVICTDIERDGMLAGPSFALYSEILSKTDVKLIASGGISSNNDIKKLKDIGCYAAITGKAVYENKLNLKDLC